MNKKKIEIEKYRLLKAIGELTNAVWVAFVCQGANSWSLLYLVHLRRDKSSEIANNIEKELHSSRDNGGALINRSKRVSQSEQSALDCNWTYPFRVSQDRFVILGVNDALAAKARNACKSIAPFLNESNERPIDSKVDLLQNTVLELQLTQQELQARISAQREAEIRLIQAAKLAAVGEMAAGIAHELNNPLTSVVGFTELALEDVPLDSSLRHDLGMVLKEAHRASSVVRRLLDFARQSETVRVNADINELVEDVILLSRHMMQSGNVQLVTHYGENLHWVQVDRNQIKQVVINLINNAIYAMPNGGKISVKTSEESRYGRRWLTLSIQDTGVGIPSENLERIFEPFFTTRGDRGGTGLGLSVTYGIVTDHGGMIEVESQVNVGSTFVVWLPLDKS